MLTILYTYTLLSLFASPFDPAKHMASFWGILPQILDVEFQTQLRYEAIQDSSNPALLFVCGLMSNDGLTTHGECATMCQLQLVRNLIFALHVFMFPIGETKRKTERERESAFYRHENKSGDARLCK